MKKDLSSYFLPEYQFFLHQIEFEKKEDVHQNVQDIVLSCSDKLSASINHENNTVTLLVTRNLSFTPDILFHASITFGATLKFSDKKPEIDWTNEDLSTEFLHNGQFVTANLMSRITLLMGEITSSSGQTPLFLPPQIISSSKGESNL